MMRYLIAALAAALIGAVALGVLGARANASHSEISELPV